MRCQIVVLSGKLADMPIMGYRQLFVKNYTVIYRVNEKDKAVIIITVRYTPSAF